MFRASSEPGDREPAPIYSYKRIRLGDVGYIREGGFHLLFSAGEPLGTRILGSDVPHTFEPLKVDRFIRRGVRPAGYLRTTSVREIGADVGASAAIPWYDSQLSDSRRLADVSKKPHRTWRQARIRTEPTTRCDIGHQTRNLQRGYRKATCL